jgi:hypothetical protein
MSEARPLPDKPLAELTDAELSAELAARRARRGGVIPTAKHYASLELQEGASLDDIEKAYRRLRAKYEPFVTAADKERSQAAQSLLDALRTAYDALRAALYSAGNTSR